MHRNIDKAAFAASAKKAGAPEVTENSLRLSPQGYLAVLDMLKGWDERFVRAERLLEAILQEIADDLAGDVSLRIPSRLGYAE